VELAGRTHTLAVVVDGVGVPIRLAPLQRYFEPCIGLIESLAPQQANGILDIHVFEGWQYDNVGRNRLVVVKERDGDLVHNAGSPAGLRRTAISTNYGRLRILIAHSDDVAVDFTPCNGQIESGIGLVKAPILHQVTDALFRLHILKGGQSHRIGRRLFVLFEHSNDYDVIHCLLLKSSSSCRRMGSKSSSSH
jgi:hypothetical protein